MTTFIVNNRTDSLKTDNHFVFFDYKLSNFPLSLADASHESQIHVSVQISQWARVNFCSYRKKTDWSYILVIESYTYTQPYHFEDFVVVSA